MNVIPQFISYLLALSNTVCQLVTVLPTSFHLPFFRPISMHWLVPQLTMYLFRICFHQMWYSSRTHL